MTDRLEAFRVHPSVSAVRRDIASERFFDAAREGVLLIQQCDICEHFVGPSGVVCTKCGAPSLHPVPASGHGIIVSWATVPARPVDGVQLEPVTGGLVELEEGPWIWAGFLLSPEEMAAGRSVQVVFVPSGEEFVPFFGPSVSGS